MKLTVEAIIAKCEPEPNSGCWLWPGVTIRGYGQVSYGRANRRVHRLVWEHFRGPIPDGLQLDHLCRTRACANPDHLEVVDSRTNTLRGVGLAAVNIRKTHCKAGHELVGENVRSKRSRNGQPWRECRVCLMRRSRAFREARRGAS